MEVNERNRKESKKEAKKRIGKSVAPEWIAGRV